MTYCHESYRLINGLTPSEHGYHKCRAVKRYKNEKGETRYLVDLYYNTEDDDYSYSVVKEVLFDVPRDVFHFEDAAYSRDHCLPYAFRHPMMIPDEIFPKTWMNLNQ